MVRSLKPFVVFFFLCFPVHASHVVDISYNYLNAPELNKLNRKMMNGNMVWHHSDEIKHGLQITYSYLLTRNSDYYYGPLALLQYFYRDFSFTEGSNYNSLSIDNFRFSGGFHHEYRLYNQPPLFFIVSHYISFGYGNLTYQFTPGNSENSFYPYYSTGVNLKLSAIESNFGVFLINAGAHYHLVPDYGNLNYIDGESSQEFTYSIGITFYPQSGGAND